MKKRTKNQFSINQAAPKLRNFYGNVYKHMVLPTYLLESSQAYQRKVDPKHVDRIIENFNLYYLDEVVVSFRDGKYYVVDGQNRIVAFITMNGGNHCLVNCKVFQGLTYEDEAAMFYHLDAIKNKIKYHEMVKAMAEAEDNPSVEEIKRIMAEVGLRWNFAGSKSGSRNTVSASRALIDSYETYGGVIMQHALQLLVQTWAGDHTTLTAPFIKGICLFTRAYAQQTTMDNFIRKFRSVTASEIKMMAQQETNAATQDLKYAKAFLRRYNQNRQAENRLPDVLDDVSVKARKYRASA